MTDWTDTNRVLSGMMRFGCFDEGDPVGKTSVLIGGAMTKTTFATIRVLACVSVYLLSAPFFVIRAESGNSFVIRNARVFDGSKLLGQSDVWVSDGKIKAVGKNLKVPADVKVVDASGGTLLPGLIDAHTHTRGDALKRAEIFGVTTELDMFTVVHYMHQTKKDQAEGKETEQADQCSAGTLATTPG